MELRELEKDKEGKELGKEVLKLSGELELVVRDKEGKVREREKLPNLIVTVGKVAVARLLNGVVTNFFDHIALGLGTVPPVVGDATLGSEITTGGGNRALATLSYEPPKMARFVKVFNFTGTFAVTESGIFDLLAGGNMLCRQTFTAKNVSSGESLEVIWLVTVG